MEEVKNLIVKGGDSELVQLAKEELQSLQGTLEEIEMNLVDLLIPQDELDSRNAVVEVRAGKIIDQIKKHV